MEEGSKEARWAVDVVVIENETVVMEREQAPAFRAGSCDLDAAICTAPQLDPRWTRNSFTRAAIMYQLTWGMRCRGRSLL